VIVRDDAAGFLLITQPDHARLAEEIVSAMRTEPTLLGPDRQTILLATREHDNGWADVDSEPTIELETGRPCDFISGPAAVKHELWPRAVTRVARTNPRAGALIAEHALTVYGYRRMEADWIAFFETMTSLRDALLERIGSASEPARRAFEDQYRAVRLGDSLSLQFCNGWTEAHTTFEYRAVMDGTTLVISPDPFAGAIVPLRVIGRRIPARRYHDDADLRAAIATATPEIVTGHARGA
jgi:hypothetical protein